MSKSNGDSKNTLYCSFCGKSQHEVRKLIAGPTVFICDECVELCMDIIREESKSSLVKSRDGVPTPKEIRRVLDDSRRRGKDGVVCSSQPEMRAAHRIYERLGFRRVPERDWSPVPGVELLAFALSFQARPASSVHR